MTKPESNSDDDATRASAALKTFPQVDHHQATGELARIYEDIHCTLRLPWVAFAIRVLSQFPHFVPAAWAALKPHISTRYASATLEDTGLDASKEKGELAEAREQLARVIAQREGFQVKRRSLSPSLRNL